MTEIPRVRLFGKLNPLAYKSVESATAFCKLRGNPYVELEHWLNQILQYQDSDVHHVLKAFSLEPSRLAKDLTQSLDQLPRGATSISDFSCHLEEAVERAWIYATLMFGESQVRSGYMLVGILKTPGLRNVLQRISSEFAKIEGDALTRRFGDVVKGSPEEGQAPTDHFELAAGAQPGEVNGALPPAQMGEARALQRFSVDLTERAANAEMDPVLGRDEEIRQIVDILMRRRQNNPILTGEAGVGKTAIVEGFAQRIAAGDVPPPLRDVTLRMLDVGLLQAGASMKGEFENRLKQVIEEVQASEKPVILFIDEAHTLIGAGGATGTGDAANLLKPALARGTLRTIAATTWTEYKKYIEKDPALTRRFQVVQVGEPDEETALRMMRGIASTLERHHRVLVLDEALEASVGLSSRYIPARQLPDKSVSLLDTACARVAIGQAALPAQVEDSRRAIEALETELAIARREKAMGEGIGDREERVLPRLAREQERLAALEERWAGEKALVDDVLKTRARLGSIGDDAWPAGASSRPPDRESTALSSEADADEPEHADLLAELSRLQEQLHEMQGDKPLILPSVDAQAVASVVADWTGIPVGRMVKNEIETVLNLDKLLAHRVIGQDHALEMISRRIHTSRAALDNPGKPIGVFLLCGPSGVGKTETGLALADALYGGEQNIITINMSEFQEAHTVSTLKGAPPGYVGYGEGGVLTEAVRRKPYSVVLLDEVEKAHPDVHEIFFQVFDKGWMEDGEGRPIDFKNTLILLTSNVGTERIDELCKDPDLLPGPDAVARTLRDPLLKTFPAALLGRLVVIPYYPLSDEMLAKIIHLQLARIVDRVRDNHGVCLEYDEDVITLVGTRCTEVESGARMVDSILTNTVLPEISRRLLSALLEGRKMTGVKMKVRDGEFEYTFT